MANVDELCQMATDFYARGQSSNDPSTKQMLMSAAHDYLSRQKKCDAALNYHHRDFALFAGWQWYPSVATRRSDTMFSFAPNAAPSF
jgi:hypothetical protein